MAKTSAEVEEEFIEGLKPATGKNLKEWLAAINNSGLVKRNDIIQWLKSDPGFGHMHASLLAGIYLNNGNPVYASETELLNNQFKKYPEMRPLFEQLRAAILKQDNAAGFVVKKTYVSITKKREFAAINIRKGELRLGMDLGDFPFDALVQKSKLTGPMPRISHMIVIRSGADITATVFEFLAIADKSVNPGIA